MFLKSFLVNEEIIQQLKTLGARNSSITYFEDFKLDQIVFSFPLTPQELKIEFPTEITFLELLEMAKENPENRSDLSSKIRNLMSPE